MSLPGYAMNQASFPEMYERWLAGPLFRPWAEMTLEEIGLSLGRSCPRHCLWNGNSRACSKTKPRAGRIRRRRRSQSRYAGVARTVAADIDWRQGDATALPLHETEQFDVVVCQQGLQFVPDKPAAAAQMRRALANGGRLAVSTWRSDDEIPFFLQLRYVAERQLGAIADQRYSYGDAASLDTLLREAGFREVQSRPVSRTIRFDDGGSSCD